MTDRDLPLSEQERCQSESWDLRTLDSRSQSLSILLCKIYCLLHVERGTFRNLGSWIVEFPIRKTFVLEKNSRTLVQETSNTTRSDLASNHGLPLTTWKTSCLQMGTYQPTIRKYYRIICRARRDWETRCPESGRARR